MKSFSHLSGTARVAVCTLAVSPGIIATVAAYTVVAPERIAFAKLRHVRLPTP